MNLLNYAKLIGIWAILGFLMQHASKTEDMFGTEEAAANGMEFMEVTVSGRQYVIFNGRGRAGICPANGPIVDSGVVDRAAIVKPEEVIRLQPRDLYGGMEK